MQPRLLNVMRSRRGSELLLIPVLFRLGEKRKVRFGATPIGGSDGQAFNQHAWRRALHRSANCASGTHALLHFDFDRQQMIDHAA